MVCTSRYRGHGDLALMRVFLFGIFLPNRVCILEVSCNFLPKRVSIQEIFLQNKVYFDFFTRKPYAFHILLFKNNENL